MEEGWGGGGRKNEEFNKVSYNLCAAPVMTRSHRTDDEVKEEKEENEEKEEKEEKEE